MGLQWHHLRSRRAATLAAMFVAAGVWAWITDRPLPRQPLTPGLATTVVTAPLDAAGRVDLPRRF